MKLKSQSRQPRQLPNKPSALEVRLGQIEYVPTAGLKPYSRALHKHSEKQVTKIAASIGQFGFINPVLADDEGNIIVGHARLKAAERLGMTEVPVIRITNLSKAEVRAFRIADNKLGSLAVWDRDALVVEMKEVLEIDEFSIELTGFDTAEIDLMFDVAEAQAAADEDDDVPAAVSRSVSQLGDLWLLGEHRLLCGSSLDQDNWSRLLEGRRARMALTDPPYNVRIGGHVSGLGKVRHSEFEMASGEMSEAEFITFNEGYLSRLKENVTDGGTIFAFMDWGHLFELLTASRAVGLEQLNLCVWNKTNGGMGGLYRSKHELAGIFKVGSEPYVDNIKLGSTGRYRTNVWDFAGANSFGATRMEDLADHPTVKPVAMFREAIRDVTNRGDLVIDAFIGSGTTIMAAERTGRVAAGIELNPTFVDVAIRRWEKRTGKTATLAGTDQSFADVARERQGANAEGEAPQQ